MASSFPSMKICYPRTQSAQPPTASTQSVPPHLQRLRRADDRMVHKAEEELLESPAASFYELSIEPVEVWVDPRLVRKGRNEVAGVLLLQLDVQPDEVIEPSVNYDLTRRVLFKIRLR
eukprot:452613-Hanusia_phi.AAC.9